MTGRRRHTDLVANGDGPPTILVAVDGSETSMRAGAYAAGLARRQHARLICLYVRSPGAMAGLSPAAVGPLYLAHNATAEEIRHIIAANVDRIGVEVVFMERSGSPGAEIARMADDLRVDAVVVGASTRAGRRFIGSIASYLVRIARWPVTVVP